MKEQINIKYLKKHKVPLIAISVLIVALIFIALFAARSNKMKQREQEAALKAQRAALETQEQFTEDEERLNEMAEYLNEMDNTVTANTEHLAEASLLQIETEKTLTEFSESLVKMVESLSCVENLISRQTEKQTEQNSEILLSVSALSETQKEIRARIADCNAALYSRRKKHFIFDSINTITAPSFR